MLVGYDIQRASWGYAIERARAIGDIDLVTLVSRTPGEKHKFSPNKTYSTGDPHTSRYNNSDSRFSHFDVQCAGRPILNVWRLMRHEANLQSYTLNTMAHHVLTRRLPEYDMRTLSDWLRSPNCALMCVESVLFVLTLP